MSTNTPGAPERAHDEDDGPRETVRRALADLHTDSPWRGVLGTALQALDETGSARSRALCWLHHAIAVRLPSDARRDTLEQRVLRRAARALEDELDADDGAARHAA